MQPNFLYTQLNLLKRIVFHHFGNEFRVDVLVGVHHSTCRHFVEELTEVETDREIDQDTLVEARVVVTIDRLDVLHLWEVTEWVSGAHEFFDGALSLEAFNDEDDVLDLVLVEHHLDEAVKRVDRLRQDVGEFTHKFLLHCFSEDLDLELLTFLAGEDICPVVSVFETELELADVACLLELSVMCIKQETLSKRTKEGFGIAIVNVLVGLLGLEKHFVDGI